MPFLRATEVIVVHSTRALIVFGKLDAPASYVVRESAAAIGVDLIEASTPSALETMASPPSPLAMVVQRDADGIEEACVTMRSRPDLAGVPIVALAAERTDTAFLEAYERGCDDVVSVEGPGLARRLHLLVGHPPPQQTASRARAVIASGDVRWRSFVGRALRNAGIDPVFAGNGFDAVEAARNARLIVSADDLEPEGGACAAAKARSLGIMAPWVIIAPPKRIAAARAAAALVPTCAVIDSCAPPENAVFIANELASALSSSDGARDLRATTRLLYATTVSFRAAGRAQDDIGFTYNVSAGGCYVRTLAPLSPGEEVWLELPAPRCDRRVRLAGRGAWRRVFGPSDSASVPPGFGVQITDGLGSDLARYRAGCESLARAMARSGSIRPRWSKSLRPSEIAPAIV